MDTLLNLFIDDEREPPFKDGKIWMVVRTMEQAQEIIAEHGCPMFISFDHDLGYEGSKLLPTGLDFAKWLIDQDLDQGGRFFPSGFWFFVHSMNPVGARNIADLMFRYLMVHRDTPEGWLTGYSSGPICFY